VELGYQERSDQQAHRLGDAHEEVFQSCRSTTILLPRSLSITRKCLTDNENGIIVAIVFLHVRATAVGAARQMIGDSS